MQTKTIAAPSGIIVTAAIKGGINPAGRLTMNHVEGIVVATGLVGGFNPQPDPPGRP